MYRIAKRPRYKLLFLSALLTAVFLLRLPIGITAHELDADESGFLVQAKQLVANPEPWVSTDTQTSGPLNSGLIAVLIALDLRPSYTLLHLTATLLVCLQILTAYQTLSLLTNEAAASIGALLIALVYGLSTHSAYLHYSSELLPTLLLMGGFYLCLIRLNEEDSPSPTLVFTAALLLSAAPWCKLQAAPITAALWLTILIIILKKRSANCDSRLRELLAFTAGTALPACVILGLQLRSGGFKDFWYSYIIANIAYAGPLDLVKCSAHFLAIIKTPPLYQLLNVAIGVAVLLYVRTEPISLFVARLNKWSFAALLVYAGAALFSVCRVTYLFSHHVIFLIPPAVYLLILFCPLTTDGDVPLRDPRVRSTFIFLAVLILISSIPNIIQYINVTESMRASSYAQKQAAGPNECIAATLAEIRNTTPIHSVEIWGWSPGVYVLSDIVPATRDSNIFFVVKGGALQSYYRTRFMRDLAASKPDVFIDAVVPGATNWESFTENDGYESDPEVREFVNSNYTLIRELPLEEHSKPVRFYRRNSFSLTCSPKSAHRGG